MKYFNRLDGELFLFLNRKGTESWDAIWLFLTGNTPWYVVFGILALLSVWFYKKKFWLPILALSLSYGLADIISARFVKNFFERWRPCHNPELMDQLRLVVDSCGGQFGFVSSHAANSFALATAAFLLFSRNKWVGLGLFTWATVTSYSRIYVGVHYPGDVIFGALLGVIIAWMVSKAVLLFSKKLWQT
jgi:undecaprenyl-diphosphatase